MLCILDQVEVDRISCRRHITGVELTHTQPPLFFQKSETKYLNG